MHDQELLVYIIDTKKENTCNRKYPISDPFYFNSL